MAPMVVWFEIWHPTYSEKHLDHFLKVTPKSGLHVLCGTKFVGKKCTKTFRAIWGKFGQKSFASPKFGLLLHLWRGLSWDLFPVVLLRQPRAHPYFAFYIRPGFNHDGIEVPLTDRRAWWNILSWGVQFVDVHNKERIEWRASDRVSSQWVRGSCLDFSEHCIAFHIVPLNFSHCPFPLGLKLVVRLVATPCACNQDFSSWDWKDDHRSEWMYEHIPKIENSCVKHWMTVFAVLSEQGKAKAAVRR